MVASFSYLCISFEDEDINSKDVTFSVQIRDSENLCPHKCFGRGICSNSTQCICNSGFEGPDCSVQLIELSPGLPQ